LGVVGKILERDTYAYGYDAQTGEYANLVSKGIIGPTKVVRAALQGAASVAGLLITTEAMVAELPKKQGAAPVTDIVHDHLRMANCLPRHLRQSASARCNRCSFTK